MEIALYLHSTSPSSKEITTTFTPDIHSTLRSRLREMMLRGDLGRVNLRSMGMTRKFSRERQVGP